jgi:hypothetical protein
MVSGGLAGRALASLPVGWTHPSTLQICLRPHGCCIEGSTSFLRPPEVTTSKNRPLTTGSVDEPILPADCIANYPRQALSLQSAPLQCRPPLPILIVKSLSFRRTLVSSRILRRPLTQLDNISATPKAFPITTSSLPCPLGNSWAVGLVHLSRPQTARAHRREVQDGDELAARVTVPALHHLCPEPHTENRRGKRVRLSPVRRLSHHKLPHDSRRPRTAVPAEATWRGWRGLDADPRHIASGLAESSPPSDDTAPQADMTHHTLARVRRQGPLARGGDHGRE